MGDLGIDLGGVRYEARNFLPDDLAETGPQAAKRGADMTRRHPMPRDQFGHGIFPVSPGIQQQWAHHSEAGSMSGLFLLGAERIEGNPYQGMGPFAFLGRFRGIPCGARVFLHTETDVAGGPAPLLAGGLTVVADHEMPQAAE